MNFLKRIGFFLVIMFLIVSSFSFYYNVHAINTNKTLGDLVKELDELEREAKETKDKIVRTEQDLINSQREVNQIYNEISNIEKEVISREAEIKELTIEIQEKDVEIKELMRFLQMSKNNSIYLEYILEADTLTDFIYRIAITEQLARHNNNQIEEMNKMIAINEQKKDDLKAKEIALGERQAKLKRTIVSLGEDRRHLSEFNISLGDEIKTSREVVEMYRKAGCKDHELISICANKLLPPDTRFWRPMVQGYVTSEYGPRIHPITGASSFHRGIDLSNSDRYNTLVYSTANGKVAFAGTYHDGRGYFVMIHHKINGKHYTSQYYHLKANSIRVKAGDVVTKDTIIGTMGTTGGSTGEHLHFQLHHGLVNNWYESTFDPRLVVNFPSVRRVFWYNRIYVYN